MNIATSLKERESNLESLPKGVRKKSKKDPKTPKEKKPKTREVSFALYKEDWSVEAIAKERTLAEATIESHLSYYVSTGEIDVEKFMTKTKVNQIIKVSETIESEQFGPIKSKLGDEFSYSDIRFAIAYKHYLRETELTK